MDLGKESNLAPTSISNWARAADKKAGAPDRPGGPPTQPAEQHHPGLGAGRELRVPAARLGVFEGSTLPPAAVDRQDRGVQVDR
jgi:hypothetical protein